MTAVAVRSRRLSREDLLTLPELGRYEALIDGELRERQPSVLASVTSAGSLATVRDYVPATGIGSGFAATCGVHIFPWQPSLMRFGRGLTLKQRLSRPGHGHFTLAPDWLLEVESPSDGAHGLELKLRDYRPAGVRMAWVASPSTRTITVHCIDGAVTPLPASDTFEGGGGDLLPGFSTPVADVFLPEDEDDASGLKT